LTLPIPAHSHRNAILLMLVATFLWSIAGVFTRHLEHARSWEVTFWRSLFAFAFMAVALLWQHRGDRTGRGGVGAWQAVRRVGWPGLLSGAMWATMFTCFMLALTQTTTANTLIVNSLSPLFAAVLSWIVLKQPVARRTWIAIGIAIAGMVWMFHAGIASDRAAVGGTLIAFGVPIAAAINVVTIKKVGHRIDLVPAVLIGALLSAALTLPLATPLSASGHDIAILGTLGVLQLGLPCMLMVWASRQLSAAEIALFSLLEVVEGPLWSWLFAGERIAGSTIGGGLVVLVALVVNEAVGLQSAFKRRNRATGLR
jgi:drug/metabolite transporter (DMT)-like permease